MYTRIIVPLDGSELAEHALPHATALARALQVPMHLVRVVDLTRLERYGAYGAELEFGGLDEVSREEASAARLYLMSIEEKAISAGVTVNTHILQGLVVPLLIRFAGVNDLITVASHGRSGISRWFLGSVAEELARKSTSPVLIVRAIDPPVSTG